MATHTTISAGEDRVRLNAVMQRTEELSEKYVGPVCIPNVMVLTICIRMETMIRLFQGFNPKEKEPVAKEEISGDAALENRQAKAMRDLAGEGFLSSRRAVPPMTARQQMTMMSNKQEP